MTTKTRITIRYIMIALSTSWKSREIDDGKEIISQIMDAGFGAIELDCFLSAKTVEGMIPMIGKSIQAVSIQNFCPITKILPKSMAGMDAFLLSSPDKEQRELAIKYSFETIEIADSAEARNLICHFGYVDMDDPTQSLIELNKKGMRESDDFESLILRAKDIRESKIQRHLDALFFSLEKLIRRAEDLGIYIGIENRHEFRQIPNYDEIDIILNEFKGANIAYWHNTEYAQLHEELDLANHEDVLKKLSYNMRGIHFPIAPNNKSDGENKLTESINVKAIKQHINENTIKVIYSPPELSIEYLMEVSSYLESELA